jgi:hypothetical protein
MSMQQVAGNHPSTPSARRCTIDHLRHLLPLGSPIHNLRYADLTWLGIKLTRYDYESMPNCRWDINLVFAFVVDGRL